MEVTYYGRKPTEEEIQISPLDLIAMRKYRGGYDKKHTDFFNEVGEFAILTLKNEGYGWWAVQ
jgi:hypothetical protein